MEAFLDGIGIAALVVLALVGALIGFGIAKAVGRRGLLGAALGAVAGMATPFVLAALGVTILVGAGLALVALVGAVGAAVIVGIVLALVRR